MESIQTNWNPKRYFHYNALFHAFLYRNLVRSGTSCTWACVLKIFLSFLDTFLSKRFTYIDHPIRLMKYLKRKRKLLCVADKIYLAYVYETLFHILHWETISIYIIDVNSNKFHLNLNLKLRLKWRNCFLFSTHLNSL